MRLVKVFAETKTKTKAETKAQRKRRMERKFLFKARIASGLEKVFGIMFSHARFSPLIIEFGLEARGLNAIHSFFCPSFDAVFLDSRKRVVDVARVKPFSFSIVSRAPCKFVVELPAGNAQRLKLSKGLKLSWS